MWGTVATVGGVPGSLRTYGYVADSFILGAVTYLASQRHNANNGIDLFPA